MAFYGEVTGKDRIGNYILTPNGGGRKVVLQGSRTKKIDIGEEIIYDEIRLGDNVDFADSYKLKSGQAIVSLRAGELRHTSSLEEALSGQDLAGVEAIVVYDTSPSAKRFHFIALSPDKSKMLGAVRLVYELGTKGSKDGAINSYTSKEGIYGEKHHTVNDFRTAVSNEPKNESILFVPLLKLTIGPSTINASITYAKLKECVDAAIIMQKTENLEEKL